MSSHLITFTSGRTHQTDFTYAGPFVLTLKDVVSCPESPFGKESLCFLIELEMPSRIRLCLQARLEHNPAFILMPSGPEMTLF